MLLFKKLIMIALLGAVHCASSQDISTPKIINWGNAAKATFLSGASTFCALFGCLQIILAIVVNNMAKHRANYKQQSVQDCLLQIAPHYVIPLCASVGFALMARNYMKKIWENKTKK